jgi:hypothetical protein
MSLPPKNLSKEELFYYKLRHDKQWYIENFLKIRDKSATIIPFNLNRAQEIVLDYITQDERANKPKRYIVLKARQMGLSTLFEALIFHDTSTHENKNALIIAHEESASSNLFNMSKLYYENIPELIRPMKKYSNGKILSFENPTTDDNEKQNNPGLRSKITIATAGSGEVGRSATIHSLHASEVAFFPDAKTTMLGLLQSIPDHLNTMVVLESTANGVGDWFHEMWQKATRGENEFVPIFLPWFIDPGYTRSFRTDGEKTQFADEVNTVSKDMNGNESRTYEYELMVKNDLTLEQLNWRRWAIANKCQGDEELFMQEYPSTPEEAFISSGRPKFAIKSLKKYQTITKEGMRGYLVSNQDGKIEFLEDSKGYVTIWQMPSSVKQYAIGADVAEGLVQGDYSCAVVGDTDSFDMVAMWHGHIDPDLFGVELVKLARFYNDAYLGVENNNHGLTTLTSIKKLEYWNVYFSKIHDRISDTMTQKLGWTTSARTKPFMIDKLAEFVREMYLGIYSDLMISEMFTYVIEDNGKTNAQSGCYDDTVMASAIMLQLLLEGRGEYYIPEIPIDQRSKSSSHIIDPLFEVEIKDEYTE